MEDPGSFSGRLSSPNPLLGPDPKNLISLAILCKEVAKVDNYEWNAVRASLVPNASNLLGDGLKSIPVILLN